jgi:hypothetical protein
MHSNVAPGRWIGYAACPTSRTEATMAAHKDSYDERIATAANARKAALEKFRAKPPADDPAVLARQAAQQAVIDARAVRAAERQAAREVEAARKAAEDVARLAEEAAREAEKAVALAAQAARKLAEEAERKAIRDARYAARKARR